MTENERIADYNGQEDEKKIERRNTNHVPEQRTILKTKDKVDESHLPTPPPDPWASPWSLRSTRSQAEMTQIRTLEEDEEIIAYLTNLGVPPSEAQTSECPSRNSTTSTIGNLCSEEAFEHLSRLYALTEQILELRDRNAKFFKRVRNLEKLKVLRKADRRLENTFAIDKYPMTDISDADTEFAESLLNAMLSNCRDPPFQRRNIRSPSSRQTRSKFNVEKQMSTDASSKNGPKVSKWTRVKAAFKWERACTNDIAETTDTTTATIAGPLPSSTKYLRIPEVETGNSSSTSDSPGINEISDSALPFPPTSSASSSNEGSFDCFQNNASNHLECLSLKTKEGKREPITRRRSQSLDGDMNTLDSEQANDTVSMSEVGQGRPLIRITSDKNHSMRFSNEMDGKGKEEISKRPALSLTIAIPSHEEEIRCMYSPESNSPLPSSTHTSGGNSPQPRKIHRELSTSGDFKRQQSLGEESLSLTSETQGQDSKWNKVRRAFLTNATRSVPPSPIRAVSRQMFLQDGHEAPIAYSCSGSMDNLEKITALNGQVDARQDYRVLRGKLGAEFHSKLVEWERLKSSSPRVAAKNMREAPFPLLNTREKLLSEERLAPEFRKKLEEWKRLKKERRGSAPFEQQRVSRRRLTDWQVWRSPSKSECKSQETIGLPGSCGSGESIHRDGKSRLFEDFVRKMETWKKVNDSNSRDTKYFIRSNSNRLGIVAGIDESEFLALERVLSFFDNTVDKERRESDARELDECFDSDTRSYGDGAQNINSNEVLIRTSVGSYRFEGISREFTRKLYDWEKHRGISPRSSTFRLLGSAYEPFTRKTNIGIPRSTTTDMGSDEQVLFKSSTLKISKSVDDLVVGSIQNACFIRRSISLPSLDHLTNKLKTPDRGNMVPTSIDCQRGEDAQEDVIMDDSEPEAMIVDIEDVIEETASPLERVQPHQTPVYSVAASETISIAVPLGTVTSTHEPSPVLFVEVVESLNRKQWESKRWNKRQSFSSEDSLNAEDSKMPRIWNNEKSSARQNDTGSECSSVTRSLNKKKHSGNESFEYSDQDIDKDSVKSDSSICSVEMNKESREVANQNRDNIERREISTITTDGENGTETTGERYSLDGTNENKTIHSGNLGNRPPFAISIKDSMDLPSEQKHQQECHGQRGEGDGSSDDEKDITEVGTKYGREYEEITLGATIDPYCRSFADARLTTNYDKCSANTESSANCKLDESNRSILDMNSYHANRINDGFKEHVKNYDAIKDEIFNLNTCFDLPSSKMDLQRYKCLDREKRNSCVAETTMFKDSTEKYNRFENVSMSPTLRARNPCNREYYPEPTIRTTSLTVAPCRQERCVERIVISEETLNKIVVPTASNNCTENIKILKPTVEHSTDKDLTKQHDYRPNINRETSINQESGVQKQYSPTRNVLIKTKRIIFSPFRHVEDHSIVKKENKASEDNHTFSTKSKSKSRSASPKINRQDALLRMSFSLPWPLRSSSKDPELKDTATTSDNKEDRMAEVAVQQDFQRNKCVENKRKSSIDESKVLQQTRVEHNMRSLADRSSSIGPAKENRSKCFVEQKEDRRSVSVQVTPIEQQHNRTCVTDSSPTLKREEKTNEATSSSTFDAYSSDLMHKLEILSSVVAKRDGRPNTLSEELSLESHSLRIRRAKEDFLSGRGGPLCHSMLEPRSSNDHCFPETSGNHCKQILQDEQNSKDEISDIQNCTLKLDETANRYEAKGEAIKEERVKMLVREDGTIGNELLRSSVVSLPDRVKSATAGMMSIDPDTFKRLEDSSRGCESFPRTITKQQEPPGPLAKIVSKLRFARLMRGKDVDEGNMSTVSRLCRQSLLIDVRDNYENQWQANDRDETRQLNNIDEASREE